MLESQHTKVLQLVTWTGFYNPRCGMSKMNESMLQACSVILLTAQQPCG